MINEIWKPVVGYEGLYEVSNYGRIKSLAKREIPILQYSLEGEFITEWTKGAMSVQKKYGWSRTNICACCKGKQQSAYGFKWAYKK